MPGKKNFVRNACGEDAAETGSLRLYANDRKPFCR